VVRTALLSIKGSNMKEVSGIFAWEYVASYNARINTKLIRKPEQRGIL
jgi:hypothetical protein